MTRQPNSTVTPTPAPGAENYTDTLSAFKGASSHPALRRSQRRHIVRYIALKLATMGLPTYDRVSAEFLELTHELIKNHQEKTRQLAGTLSPVDARIQAFLNEHLADVQASDGVPIPRLPASTLVLDRQGMARELSLPVDGDRFSNDYVESYRLKNGVLHNPRSDRRTTQGVFHVTEGGLPVPADKKAVPKGTFTRILAAAFQAPPDLLKLPFLSDEAKPVETWVSLMLRPMVAPPVPGIMPRKTMEVRFFAPASLVCNLDFVESIFGNAGDPSLPENNAALDVEEWCGVTGCVVLAPHLTKLTKVEVGLPHYDEATDRQRREGMCWKHEHELYNDGSAFKLTCRTDSGVVVTVIADNYFGYCKKEVKTQISYAANLFGGCEEEHAGGALAFPRYNLGDVFRVDSRVDMDGHTIAEVIKTYGHLMDVQPEGHAIDRNYPDVVYVPEDVQMELPSQTATWTINGQKKSIFVEPGVTYIHPSGYKVMLEKHPAAPSWRFVGTVAEGTFCHKPCTVSGGGKSEISKPLEDFFVYGSIYINDFEKDMDAAQAIIDRDYSDRRKVPDPSGKPSRKILSPERSLGSVIKLLTPSTGDYTPEYNAWLETIPDHVKVLVFTIKRWYRPEWGNDWRSYFSTDLINGMPGHELKYNGRPLVGQFLRVGLQSNGNWRLYKLRQDFMAAAKIQMEDDITASTVVPADWINHRNPRITSPSIKLSLNCEARLFQRPDEAIHRGMDRLTENDLSHDDNFISNFEPLTPDDARELMRRTIEFHAFTEPIQKLIASVASGETGARYFVSSAHPRIVDGKPTKNPRYLQVRPDLLRPRESYVAEMGIRLHRRIPAQAPVAHPVNAVLPGRRNNPPEPKAGIRALCVYNPIHYQELPELFMDFVASLTGKSPSTTGAGSEGALTKGPFNAINTTADLNDALVSYILTGFSGFTTCAGFVGPKYQVDHDISLLIPEIWSRLSEQERDPQFLIENRCLEPVKDFQHNGRTVLASRLGWRITRNFLRLFAGRIMDSPTVVFNEEMLRPETQDIETFVDGVNNITEAQQRVAQSYLDDGSVKAACPPLQALIHIMATGSYKGMDAHHPDVRAMFTREYLVNSDWYAQRLDTKQQREVSLWRRHVRALEAFASRHSHADEIQRMRIPARLEAARRHLGYLQSPAFREALVGTIGADPIYRG